MVTDWPPSPSTVNWARLVVLASATPALESLQMAEAGRYRRLVLPSRFGGATLPKIEVAMKPGQVEEVGAYRFEFRGVQETPGPNYMADRGTVQVLRNGLPLALLFPEKRTYASGGQVMTDAGWLPTQKFYNDINIGGNSVRMDQLVLEILGAVVAGIAVPGSTSALMLQVAGSAISALKKREAALTLYERNMLEHGVGGTAAGTCTEINGEVTLALGTVRFIRKNTSTQVLFADWDSRDVKLYRGESVFRKVPAIVEQTRDEILGKLGGNAKSKITDYEI